MMVLLLVYISESLMSEQHTANSAMHYNNVIRK